MALVMRWQWLISILEGRTCAPVDTSDDHKLLVFPELMFSLA